MPPENEVDRGDNFTPEPEEQVTAPAEPEAKVDVALKDETPEPPKETKPAPEKENLIPQSRFNEAVQKERAKREVIEARAKELEGQLAVQKVSEDVVESQKLLKDMIKQRNSLLSDGELEKAGEVDEKIISLQEAIADRKAESKVMQAKEAAKEEIRYDSVVSKLENDHPELDPESDDYNQDVVDEIRVLTRGYQAEMGLSPSAALARAAKRVFGEKIKPKVDDTLGKERKTEAVAKNLDAAKKQPASTKEVGLDHDKRGGGLDAKTVIGLPFKEFSELTDEVLSRMRGDTL